MIHWDSRGLKATAGSYEIFCLPEQDGWKVVFCVGKTLIATTPTCDSQKLAQDEADLQLEKMNQKTQRILDRIGYNTVRRFEDDEDEV